MNFFNFRQLTNKFFLRSLITAFAMTLSLGVAANDDSDDNKDNPKRGDSPIRCTPYPLCKLIHINHLQTNTDVRLMSPLASAQPAAMQLQQPLNASQNEQVQLDKS